MKRVNRPSSSRKPSTQQENGDGSDKSQEKRPSLRKPSTQQKNGDCSGKSQDRGKDSVPSTLKTKKHISIHNQTQDENQKHTSLNHNKRYDRRQTQLGQRPRSLLDLNEQKIHETHSKTKPFRHGHGTNTWLNWGTAEQNRVSDKILKNATEDDWRKDDCKPKTSFQTKNRSHITHRPALARAKTKQMEDKLSNHGSTHSGHKQNNRNDNGAQYCFDNNSTSISTAPTYVNGCRPKTSTKHQPLLYRSTSEINVSNNWKGYKHTRHDTDHETPRDRVHERHREVTRVHERHREVTRVHERHRGVTDTSIIVDTGGTYGGQRIEYAANFGFPYLKQLKDKEPSHVVMALTKSPDKLKASIKRTETEIDLLELLLSVLAIAFSSRSTPSFLVTLFEVLSAARFFDTVALYLLDLQPNEEEIDDKGVEKIEQAITCMLTIMWMQVNRNPSALAVFNRVHLIIGQMLPILQKSSAPENLLTDYREYTEHKKQLDKTYKKQSSGQKQQLPPDDFRELPLLPETAEIKGHVQPFLRKNKVDGEYDDADHYLDTQFRLLREDCISPLRDGITEYINIITSKHPTVRRQRGSLRIYDSVKVFTHDVGTNGFCFKVRVGFSSHMRGINWKVSKRLIFGSLLCFSSDNFETMYFATVVNKDDMLKGILVVQFCNTELATMDLLGKEFKMVESPAYYEAYIHVLRSLQSIVNTELPFERYIVHCDSEVHLPTYLSGQTCDLRPLVDTDSKVYIESRRKTKMRLSKSTRRQVEHTEQSSDTFSDNSAEHLDVISTKQWPAASIFHMDDSQLKALHHALSREFAIIQGPPGTGKTYVGLKLMKALLHNKQSWSTNADQTSLRNDTPILVVCYTNHALDQFLEGIGSFFSGMVVRVGRRFCSAVEHMTLKEHKRKKQREASSVIRKLKEQTKWSVRQLANRFDELFVRSEIYQTVLLSETCLRQVMNEPQFQTLNYNHYMRQDIARSSLIYAWLGLDQIEAIYRNQTHREGGRKETNDKEPEFVQIDTGDRESLEGVLSFLKVNKERRKAISYQTKQEVMDAQIQKFVDNENAIRKELHAAERELNALPDEVNFIDEDSVDQLKEKRSYLEYTFHVERSVREHMEYIIQNLVKQGHIMTAVEADSIENVWELDLKQRQSLYLFWVHALLRGLIDTIDSMKPDFDAAAERYKELAQQEDKEIFKCATIIGMTTTGAARYQSVLRDIQPEVIIVEEAAEVLESHIVTSLNGNCKHLILIGDHKQLRPNPAVYKLAERFNMNISLFERMIRNDVPYSCLQLQHRMRPEIANIMRFIYPQLRDHPDVKTFDDIKGVNGNLVFINHHNSEKTDEGVKSYSNVFEAEYAVRLCKYLLMQGYSQTQITILTTYTGQLLVIQKLMPRDEFKNVRVTVVDNYQGEENDIIILSLVRSNSVNKIGFLKTENRICVALSRAKKGFYIIGDFGHLAAHSELWQKITAHAKDNGHFSSGVSLYCQNHPQDDGFDATSTADFSKSPEGGCQKMCTFRLQCGHVCRRHCHILDSSHELYKCQEQCTKVCEREHPCTTKCCVDPCPSCWIKIPTVIPKCGHTQPVPCGIRPDEWRCEVTPCPHTLECGHPCLKRCGDDHTQRCPRVIEFKWRCGHTDSIKCWQKDTMPCPIKCDYTLKCGHVCTGTCGSCSQGRFHDQCRSSCNRILVCGHECKDNCENCPPCSRPCKNRCVHSECKLKCGEPCVPCMEMCTWKCRHYTCTKRCSEPCNRPPCNQACTRKLKCGHRCIGLCGEPCPKYCRNCNKDVVTELFFGNEDHKDARFIQLNDCQHIIEYEALDRYMEQANVDDNICLKGCPRCKTVIRKSVRYGNRINRTLQDIEQVKRKVKGNSSNIEKIMGEIKYDGQVTRKLSVNLDHMGTHTVVSEKILEAVKCQVNLANELVAIKRKLIAESKSKVHDLNVVSNIERYLEKLMKGRTFMSEQEVSDVQAECYRGNVCIEHLKIRKKVLTLSKANQQEAQTELNKLQQLIDTDKAITEDIVEQIKEVLETIKRIMKVEVLGIDEEEKLQIINAVGLRQGHWFKCPNGKCV